MKRIEVEVKSACDDFKPVLEAVKGLGYVYLGKFYEVDQYYNHPCRNFKESDEALRIRSIDDKHVLTYKGPKIGIKGKSREERETAIEDLDAMNHILINTGFVKTAVVKKYREEYICGDIHICFDDVTGIGKFVEVEKIGFDLKTLEDEVLAFANDIGLIKFTNRSYLGMVLEGQE